MIKKPFALYRSLFICLCLLLGCASTTAPYQAMSEAKQALRGAHMHLGQQQPAQPIDTQDYQRAESALQAAEQALSNGQYDTANTLIQESKAYSQAILKRLRKAASNGIKFRY